MNEKLLPEISKQSHPEHFCDKCGGKNLLSWYADSDEWNKIVGDDYSILCPICFAEIADEKGLRPTAWRLSREGDSPEIDKLRIRIHELLFTRQPELKEANQSAVYAQQQGLKYLNENLILRKALEKIANPIKSLLDELQPGQVLNGVTANQLSNNANYLKQIADTALTDLEAKGGEE